MALPQPGSVQLMLPGCHITSFWWAVAELTNSSPPGQVSTGQPNSMRHVQNTCQASRAGYT